MDHSTHHHQQHPAGHAQRDNGAVAHAAATGHGGHDHGAMIDDFRRRFWVSAALTIPIVLLSHGFWELFGVSAPFAFAGGDMLVFALSTVVYFYGGRPLLTGLMDEVGRRLPGMMTLVAVAITVAYVYSTAVVFGLNGMGFYWELATLIDIMLVGHWIEMRSVMGASSALEALVRLLPSAAHRLRPDGTTDDIPIGELKIGERVLVKPGERVPTDGVVVTGRSSLDESMLTGESKPIDKREGMQVIGGSVNGEG